jgi:antitoxin (DNA-binding transcriptional repressor) of toxin-antitoxin stability system
MKAIPVQEAQGQLGQLIAEACRGEIIVLTDGDKRVTLEPGVALDLEVDSPELEAELLKTAKGPFTPLREGELREIADRALREHRARRRG